MMPQLPRNPPHPLAAVDEDISPRASKQMLVDVVTILADPPHDRR
jgi:hypothetical protein